MTRRNPNPRHWEVEKGDALKRMRKMADDSFDGVLSDPPYGLGFMQKKWDAAVPDTEVWREVLRVCKPGAFLLAFGGTRTFHRLTCSIEDAGWEVRDCLCWLYGEGFPKSLDISKAIDKKLGGKRKVVMEKRNPHRGVDADPWYGFHSLDKPIEPTAPATRSAKQWEGYGTQLKPAWEPILLAMKPKDKTFDTAWIR